jgi:hypothetical protein
MFPLCVPCSYNDAGVALLRPLVPGQETWPELLAAADKQKAAEATAEAALASVTQVSSVRSRARKVQHIC